MLALVLLRYSNRMGGCSKPARLIFPLLDNPARCRSVRPARRWTEECALVRFGKRFVCRL